MEIVLVHPYAGVASITAAMNDHAVEVENNVIELEGLIEKNKLAIALAENMFRNSGDSLLLQASTDLANRNIAELAESIQQARQHSCINISKFGRIVQSTHTDADGKYSITDVTPGSYCVVTFFYSTSNQVEWCVPVKVTTESITVDIYNGNATIIMPLPRH